MDPFDEFEFKPITEGIGFHKKTGPIKKDVETAPRAHAIGSPLQSQQIPQKMSQPRIGPDLSQPKYTMPAPSGPTIRPEPRGAPVSPEPRGIPASPKLPFHDFVEKPKAATWREQQAAQVHVRTTNQTSPKEDANVYIPAIIFDSIVVVGLTCVFAVAVLLVVDVDLLNILRIAREDFMTSLSLILLCVSVLELYFIIFRSFLGSTLGEWAFDIQLGTKSEQASPYYPLRVIWRSVIVIATGFITLPILSLIVGRDLAGYLAGISLKRSEPIG